MASEDQSNIKLRAAMLTDVGVVREHNEDFAYVDSAYQFFIVADGMGGHAAGEVASAMAVQAVREALEEARQQLYDFVATPTEDGRKELVALLERAVRTAHQAVFDRGSRETDKQGMGTTLDVVLVAGPEAFVAHVGDSRTYLIRDGQAGQITTDHTVAEVLVIEGKLSVEEAQLSPLRTILVNAIGVAADVGIEMAHVQLREGDALLVCSDGLHDYFTTEQELADRIAKQAPDKALAELISLAKERGGHDNITGIVVQVTSCEEGDSTGAVTRALDDSLSDGVPAPIERDDTAPLDEEESQQFPGLHSLWMDESDDDRDRDEDDDLAERPTQPMDVVLPLAGEADEDEKTAKVAKAANDETSAAADEAAVDAKADEDEAAVDAKADEGEATVDAKADEGEAAASNGEPDPDSAPDTEK